MGAGKECKDIVPRTTIGLKRTTKARLDGNRAPGQSYEGFICQLLDAWEGLHRKKTGGDADEAISLNSRARLGKTNHCKSETREEI